MKNKLLLITIMSFYAPLMSIAVHRHKQAPQTSNSFLGVHAKTDAKKSTKLDPETPFPWLPEYYGKGYNIFKGNPLSNLVDHGFTSNRLFELTYDEDRATDDGKFYYPNEVSITSLTSCS